MIDGPDMLTAYQLPPLDRAYRRNWAV